MMKKRQHGPWKSDKATTVWCEIEMYRTKVRILHRSVSIILKGTKGFVVAMQRHVDSSGNLKKDIERDDVLGILSTYRVSYGRHIFTVNVHRCVLASRPCK